MAKSDLTSLAPEIRQMIWALVLELEAAERPFIPLCEDGSIVVTKKIQDSVMMRVNQETRFMAQRVYGLVLPVFRQQSTEAVYEPISVTSTSCGTVRLNPARDIFYFGKKEGFTKYLMRMDQDPDDQEDMNEAQISLHINFHNALLNPNCIWHLHSRLTVPMGTYESYAACARGDSRINSPHPKKFYIHMAEPLGNSVLPLIKYAFEMDAFYLNDVNYITSQPWPIHTTWHGLSYNAYESFSECFRYAGLVQTFGLTKPIPHSIQEAIDLSAREFITKYQNQICVRQNCGPTTDRRKNGKWKDVLDGRSSADGEVAGFMAEDFFSGGGVLKTYSVR
ncbi:hypothetical protein GGR57DRAFT_505792 [Xylariaceae sp. FL1272]|nr:hypothetical protein GGR57DRAFT_505792 [Xylariaceae sp. FL1272]